MRTPSSTIYLARKLTSTTIALLLLTGFIAMVVPVPIVNNNNAAAELFTSQTTEAIANVLEKTDSLEQRAGLPFVENEGQLHPDVRFYIDTFAGRVYVTDHGLTYGLKNVESNTGLAIKETFVQASSLRPYGTEQNQAVVNYYAGEKSNWRSSISTFDKVSFGEVWNGINVELNAASNNVEKIFTVAPGADARDIQVAVEGANSLNLNYQGQLVISTDLGQVVLTKPVAFQEINGQIRAVEVSYIVGQNNQYGFAVGRDYDPNFALVIDPLLASTYLGGTENEGVSPSTLNPTEGADIALDSGGNVYIAGLTLSEDYPTTTTFLPDANLNSDVVVSKLSGDLTQLLASTYIAGDHFDEAVDIAIDSSGDVYVTGRTNSTNYPTTGGALDETFNDGTTPDLFDAFVSKLDSDLALIASTYLGGTNQDEAFDIAVNAAGNVYVTGHTFSTDYPTVAGSYDTSFNAPGQAQGFVTALLGDLTGLVRSTFIGGSNDSRIHAIAIPASGEIYVAGFTLAQDFPIVGGYQATKSSQNQHDTILAVFDSTLTSLLRSTFHGAGAAAGEHTTPFGLAVTAAGKVYIAGLTQSPNFPTIIGSYDTTFDGGPRDAYVSVLSSTLDSLESSTFIGGTANDIATGLALSGTSVYVTISGGGVSYPTTAGAFDEGSNDAYISKLSLDLGSLEASTSFGGSNTNVLTAIDINPAGDVVVLGHTRSTDFPVTPGAYDTAKAGVSGAFDFTISKLTADLSAPTPSATGVIAFTSDRDGNQEIYIMNADGTGQTRLTNNAALDQHPNVSPDGTKITFESNRDGNFEIYVMNVDGTNQINLSNNLSPIFDAFPDWSPDGSQIAFTSDRDGNQEIYIMNADGTGQTRLTNNAAFDAHPTWGELPLEIAFDSTRDGNLEIYKIRTTNLLETRLTNNPAFDAFPDYSITGGFIGELAFTSDRDGNNEIYSMSGNGANQQRLTFNAADDREPSWSKDGSKNIAFRSDRDGNSEIYIMNMDGSGAVNRSNNLSGDIEPDFGPTAPSSAPTNLILDPIRDVTATTGFTVSGSLSNANTGEPVSGELITFTGSGVTPSLQAVTTDGVDFIGDINLVSCPTPAVPGTGDCVPDELSTLDSDGTDNIVLHLGVGGKITFPEGTMGAKLWIQDMGATSFKYIVEEGNNVFQPEAESGGSLAVIPIVQIITGYSTVGADFVPNGLKEITITEVGGSTSSGSVGIAAILTTNPDGLPPEQHQINFEEFSVGAKNSPFAVNAGHFFTVGFAQNTESNGPLDVTAHFAGTSAFAADDSNSEEYNVLFNTQGTQGEGAAPADNVLGGSITIATCQVDADNDGVCKTWEETGVIPGSDIPGASSAVSFVLPAGDGNRADDDNRKDIYVEIDCMAQASSGNYCPTQTELNAVITSFSRENIRVTMSIATADTNIPFNNPFHIWSANDGDQDLTNDFENIKKDYFGTSTERSQGAAGSLRSGKDLLEIKSQIYHYGLFVKNINTGNNVGCGPSGQAELRGNDFIVSLGCGFTGAKGSTQEIQGTLMHELGHNLGLTHGGLDDDNCKPNHISVMSYSRQLPWAQLAATPSGTTVNWVLTYSREDLDNLNGPLDERAVIESDGLRVTAGQWSVTLPSGYQFKLIWGQPTDIRTGVTGPSVNWDNDGNPAESTAYSQDLNKINGVLGCNPGATNLDPFQSYDEFANLDLTFRNGAGMDGLVYPDPDTLSELTPAVLEGVTSSALTLEPIADISAGGQITATGILTDLSGDPLANEIITFSGSGAENLPSATTDIDGRYTSSGNSPATVATDWEVEAHFEGTASNGPSNSNVETYDTLSEDTNPPTVTATVPADDSTGIAINVIVNAEFSEAMNEATITDTTFTLAGPGGPVSGTVTYNSGDNTASFDPSSDLASGTTYTATISGTVEDVAGNSMGTDYSWDFTTESSGLTIEGFYAPVDMEDSDGNPIVNTIKSGRAVALKFEVFDNNNVEQTSTSIVESFQAQKINCGTLQGEPVDPIEVTNAGGTGLRYDETGGIFIQNWKTPSGQAGSCYAVTLTTIDGSSITAYFRLLN